MKTNKEIGQEIRATLKEMGINSKQVSVSVKDAGYETSITATIKDLSVKILDIENLLNKYEYVDRDERTLEILAGGNTFVRVQLDREAMKIAENSKLEIAERIFSERNSIDLDCGRTLFENEQYNVAYFPHTSSGLPQVSLMTVHDGYFTRYKNYIAYSVNDIASALVLMETQEGIEIR